MMQNKKNEYNLNNIESSMLCATEIIPVQFMDSPWVAADKFYPGGWKQYAKDVFMLIF